MIQRRAADAKLETSIGCHTFRATGITDYLTNGGKLEIAQRMAAPTTLASAKSSGWGFDSDKLEMQRSLH
jgi:hypothetical protein